MLLLEQGDKPTYDERLNVLLCSWTCRYLDMLEKSLLQNKEGKEFFIGDKVNNMRVASYIK